MDGLLVENKPVSGNHKARFDLLTIE